MATPRNDFGISDYLVQYRAERTTEDNMKYVVWHAKDEAMVRGLVSKPSFPADYRRVAVVDCKDVDDVFRATNHIDESWTKNPEVVTLIEKSVRSTSVGDVVEELVPDGAKWLCAPVGWEKLAA
jgi:hypothetical protein